MQIKKSQKLYRITLVFADSKTRTVKVKAASRKVAEDRALKRVPSAIGINRPS